MAASLLEMGRARCRDWAWRWEGRSEWSDVVEPVENLGFNAFMGVGRYVLLWPEVRDTGTIYWDGQLRGRSLVITYLLL